MSRADDETAALNEAEREITEIRDRIVLAALPHVPFDGWSMRALKAGARDAGLDEGAAERVFMGGGVSAVAHFCDLADRLMVQELSRMDLASMRVHERIRAAVLVRLERWAEHREAVRRAVALLSLPQNAVLSARCTWRTVDAMWWAAGDDSHDFNHYTKRATLAAVLSATVLCWLGDTSEGCVETRAFLDRRLQDVARIPKLRARLREACSRLPDPRRLFSRSRRRRQGFGLGHPTVEPENR